MNFRCCAGRSESKGQKSNNSDRHAPRFHSHPDLQPAGAPAGDAGQRCAQTFTDYEVIVINDGSTDDTLERLQPYAGELRIISQANQGIGAARNRGIDEARGKYVALLDHDDLWKPDKLAVQVQFLEEHPTCAAASIPWAYSTDPERCVFNLKTVRDSQCFVERPFWQLSHGNLFLISSAIMFVRAKAEGLRYETRRNCIEDTPFQIGLLLRGDFGVPGEQIQMVYRWHASNYSSQAAFFYNGIRMLRELNAQGRFAGVMPGPAPRPGLVFGTFGANGVRPAIAQRAANRQCTHVHAGNSPTIARWSIEILAAVSIVVVPPTSVLRHRWPANRNSAAFPI